MQGIKVRLNVIESDGFKQTFLLGESEQSSTRDKWTRWVIRGHHDAAGHDEGEEEAGQDEGQG